jgi:DNA-binding NarL/FixJ family response regulator
MPLTVLVADPDDRTAVAFGAALRGSEFSFVGAASNGKALLDALFSRYPWAVALDLSLPDHPAAPNIGWASTVPQIREIAPNVRTLVTFRPEFSSLVPGALSAGARAFAEKPFLREEILAALRHLASDRPRCGYFARSRRVARPLAVRYRTSRGATTSVTRPGVSRNISESGVRVACSERLAPRSVLSVDIELPDRTSLHARGQVVREIGQDPSGAYEYGVGIFEMEPGHRAKLRDLVEKVLSGDPSVSGDTRRLVPEPAAR